MKKKIVPISIVFLLVVAGAVYFAKQRWLNDTRAVQSGAAMAPAPLATWPWPKATKDSPIRGVTHWLDKSSPDGTVVELIEFDFKANPRLRFAMFDQDSDDTKPWDNYCKYWNRGAAQMARQLNKNGRIVALWNGLFFGYHGGSKWAEGAAFHVSPVVLNGQVHDWGANHRWTFGVKYKGAVPTFKVAHKPSRQWLQRELDFGGGSAQCLVKNGQPLKLQPYGLPPVKQPVPSTPQEAGHIPDFDHMRSCRASIGWSKDSTKLFLLFVKEPDSETASIIAARRGPMFGVSLWGGWTVADVQKFWLEQGAWSAINSDAGDVAQLALLRRDGDYDFVPSRQGSSKMRMKLPSDFKGAPQGGALMYFYVAELGSKKSTTRQPPSKPGAPTN
jgi:hypothetical protein